MEFLSKKTNIDSYYAIVILLWFQLIFIIKPTKMIFFVLPAHVADIKVRPGLHIDPSLSRKSSKFTMCTASRLAWPGNKELYSRYCQLLHAINGFSYGIESPLWWRSSYSVFLGSVVTIYSPSCHPSHGWLVFQRRSTGFIANFGRCSRFEGEPGENLYAVVKIVKFPRSSTTLVIHYDKRDGDMSILCISRLC